MPTLISAKRPFYPVADENAKIIRGRTSGGFSVREDNVPRDRIMLVCGFPKPEDEPVISYALFASTIERLNVALRKQGQGRQVVGGIQTGEQYWISGGHQP